MSSPCGKCTNNRHLAPLCLRLVALDGSPTAIAEAKRRVQSAHVRFMQAKLPGQMPHGPFDLIVVSEIAYYLSGHEPVLLGKRLAAAVAHRGKIVLLHHRRHFHDAAQLRVLAHLRLRSQLGRIAIPIFEREISPVRCRRPAESAPIIKEQ
jgi:hypothetical protein